MNIASLKSGLKSAAASLVLGFTLILPGLSSAQADEITGVIASIDFDLIVLTDETTLMVPEDFAVDDLEPGMTIHVFYEQATDGTNVITDLELAN